jgi:protein tyrosine phosphatase (PTP) superfamily phosphohydrolase (DUF442 family)
MSLTGIRNFVPLTPLIATSGQPTAEQLAAVRDAGYETVINLLPPERRDLPDEARVVADLGMEYVNIPVVWTRPTEENLADFFAAMEARADRKVYVHCAVNMRVSAFCYLYRVLRLGVPPDEAEIELHDVWVPDGVWKDFIRAQVVGRRS